MTQQIRKHIWELWGTWSEDILFFVWKELTIKEIKNIADYYLPGLTDDKNQIIQQLTEHFFPPKQENEN